MVAFLLHIWVVASFLRHLPSRLLNGQHRSGIRELVEMQNLFFFFSFYYSYVHTRLGSFLPPCPHPLPYHPLCPLPLSPTPSLPRRNYFALISNFVVDEMQNLGGGWCTHPRPAESGSADFNKIPR
jgi:hypothetical protein